MRVTDGGGARIHDAVAKLGSLDYVRDEGDRYDNFVMRLDPRATPRKLATLKFGAGALAGIFYGLAEGFEASAFDMARYQDGQSARAIKSIEVVTKRWTDGVSETRRPIRCVRQRVLSDHGLARVTGEYPINWVTDFEANQNQTRWACIHGDLHGSNALISTGGFGGADRLRRCRGRASQPIFGHAGS